MIKEFGNGVKATLGLIAYLGVITWCSLFNKERLKDLVP